MNRIGIYEYHGVGVKLGAVVSVTRVEDMRSVAERCLLLFESGQRVEVQAQYADVMRDWRKTFE